MDSFSSFSRSTRSTLRFLFIWDRCQQKQARPTRRRAPMAAPTYTTVQSGETETVTGELAMGVPSSVKSRLRVPEKARGIVCV
jgi:hypothetical protein